MFIEEFPNGDGYWHMCFSCQGSIGESQSLSTVTLEGGTVHEFHTDCLYV